MDQVLARDDPVQPNQQKPASDDVGKKAHEQKRIGFGFRYSDFEFLILSFGFRGSLRHFFDELQEEHRKSPSHFHTD